MTLKSSGGIVGVVVVTFLVFTSEMACAYNRTYNHSFDKTLPIRNCRDVQRQEKVTSGIYTIYPYKSFPELPVQVFCDLDTDGGGWTVIQRRDDIEPREDFFRTWTEYALGFGDLAGELWLGNDHIHALTDQTLNEIRFDLADFEGRRVWAKYKFFYVHSRDAFYKLEVNGYSGNAGDSFTWHNQMNFTTKDRDLDTKDEINCAIEYKGAWWYNKCHESNLNGFYHAGNHTSYADGVNWYQWKGYYYSLKSTEMKIRPFY